jgi:hypothetical protein
MSNRSKTRGAVDIIVIVSILSIIAIISLATYFAPEPKLKATPISFPDNTITISTVSQ